MAWTRYTAVSRSRGVFASISKHGRLCLSVGACRQFGLTDTTRVDLWYDAQARRVGIKVAPDGLLKAAHLHGWVSVPVGGFCARFGISPEPGRYPVTEVDGMLVIQLETP